MPWRPVNPASVQGEVYVLHFDRPFGHARHYIGWGRNAKDRIAAHRAGRGSRLMSVIREAGIGFRVAAIMPGTRELERRLKNRGGGARSCPICHEESCSSMQ